MMSDSAAPTAAAPDWAGRTGRVRDKADLHNLSQDSGLSHSPVLRPATPQLQIGRPIQQLAPSPTPPLNTAKQKLPVWRNLGGIFKKKSSSVNKKTPSEVSSEINTERTELDRGKEGSGAPPPLPPRTSNVFQPTLEVRGGEQGQPALFPALRADLQYPARSDQLVSGGGTPHYYEPRLGHYIRPGSQYDAAVRAGLGRDSRESGVHSASPPALQFDSSLETLQGWRAPPDRPTPATSPYIHTGRPASRSLSAGPAPPTRRPVPAPPPRNPARHLQISPASRPASFSFEAVAPTPPARRPVQARLSLPGPPSPDLAASLVDARPRSRRPVRQTVSSGSNNSAAEFWRPHQARLRPAPSPTTALPSPGLTNGCLSPAQSNGLLSPAPPPSSGSLSSLSSRDSGCSETVTAPHFLLTGPRPLPTSAATTSREAGEVVDAPGFSTRKRRSRFEEALTELEQICDNIAQDEDLLDRAERRDLPTAHQELIWRGREAGDTVDSSPESSAGETGAATGSDLDNWNTSSSFDFEGVRGCVTPGRPRTAACRRAAVRDPGQDDMAVRRVSAAARVPGGGVGSLAELPTFPSYLTLSPGLSPAPSLPAFPTNTDEPDTVTDDLRYRHTRDLVRPSPATPQHKFGIPARAVSGGAASDYLHAVPDRGRYRSRFHPMRNPDLVKDDLAFRGLRKDDSLDQPDQLGIVQDPHGIIINTRPWPPEQQPGPGPVIFYPNRYNEVMQSLSENIAQIIRKQSGQPGAGLEDTLQDLSDPLVMDCMKLSMNIINQAGAGRPGGGKAVTMRRATRRGSLGCEAGGQTVFQLLSSQSGSFSEPENFQSEVRAECNSRTVPSDEGVESVSSMSDPDSEAGQDSQAPLSVLAEQADLPAAGGEPGQQEPPHSPPPLSRPVSGSHKSLAAQ